MRRVAIIWALLSLPLACRADLILDIIGGGTPTVPLMDAVGGWQFTVDRSITVSALGLWDEGANGLQIAHTVGLWAMDETLLATATVDNTSFPVPSVLTAGRWLFTDIVPIALGPGSYVLGATWGNPIGGADYFRVEFFGEPIVYGAFPGVSYDGPRAKTLLPGPSLEFPDETWGSGGIFGPNLAVVVPEPSAALLFVSTVVWLGVPRLRSWMRRSRA